MVAIVGQPDMQGEPSNQSTDAQDGASNRRRRPRGGAGKRMLQERAAELGMLPSELARVHQRDRTARRAEDRKARWATASAAQGGEDDVLGDAASTLASANGPGSSDCPQPPRPFVRPSWRFVSGSGAFELTGRSIMTVRHGDTALRPELRFSCSIECASAAWAAPPGSGEPHTVRTSTPAQMPFPPPTRLAMVSRCAGRCYAAERLSTSAWDALPSFERATRLKQARHGWEGVDASALRTASTFEVIPQRSPPVSTMRTGSAEHGERPREKPGDAEEAVHEEGGGDRLTLQLAFYACDSGLSGGTLELRLDDGTVDAQVGAGPTVVAEDAPLAITLTIPWGT